MNPSLMFRFSALLNQGFVLIVFALAQIAPVKYQKYAPSCCVRLSRGALRLVWCIPACKARGLVIYIHDLPGSQ
jgi:hypothetical protein